MPLAARTAFLIAALFAGAAIYVSVAEHPARLALDDAAALAQWKPSYSRGKLMQASLALIGSLLAFWVWWQDRNLLWLAGHPDPDHAGQSQARGDRRVRPGHARLARALGPPPPDPRRARHRRRFGNALRIRLPAVGIGPLQTSGEKQGEALSPKTIAGGRRPL